MNSSRLQTHTNGGFMYAKNDLPMGSLPIYTLFFTTAAADASCRRFWFIIVNINSRGIYPFLRGLKSTPTPLGGGYITTPHHRQMKCQVGARRQKVPNAGRHQSCTYRLLLNEDRNPTEITVNAGDVDTDWRIHWLTSEIDVDMNENLLKLATIGNVFFVY